MKPLNKLFTDPIEFKKFQDAPVKEYKCRFCKGVSKLKKGYVTHCMKCFDNGEITKIEWL